MNKQTLAGALVVQGLLGTFLSPARAESPENFISSLNARVASNICPMPMIRYEMIDFDKFGCQDPNTCWGGPCVYEINDCQGACDRVNHAIAEYDSFINKCMAREAAKEGSYTLRPKPPGRVAESGTPQPQPEAPKEKKEGQQQPQPEQESKPAQPTNVRAAMECVADMGSANRQFRYRNTCGQSILLMYCFEQTETDYNCGQSGFGTVILNRGEAAGLGMDEYVNGEASTKGNVKFAACNMPEDMDKWSGATWDRASNNFRCGTEGSEIKPEDTERVDAIRQSLANRNRIRGNDAATRHQQREERRKEQWNGFMNGFNEALKGYNRGFNSGGGGGNASVHTPSGNVPRPNCDTSAYNVERHTCR